MSEGQFWYCTESGEGSFTGPFDTREDALAEARSMKADGSVWTAVGIYYKPDLGQLGEDVLETLYERANDPPFSEDGPWSEWPEIVPAETKRLDSMLAETVKQWLDETCNWPNWLVMKEVEEHQQKDEPLTIRNVVTALLLTEYDDHEALEQIVALWTPEQRREAFLWVMTEHVHASDNDDVERLPKPTHVQAIDRAALAAMYTCEKCGQLKHRSGLQGYRCNTCD